MKRIILTWLIITLTSGCAKINDSFDNLSNGHIYIIGHGGSGFSSFSNYYPPDSWNSVTRAIEIHNAEGVEIDVQMSKDSVLFMFHDQALDELCSCKGCIHDYESFELLKCNFKTVQGQISTESLSPLDRVIERFSQRSIKPKIFLDLQSACSVSGTLPGNYPPYEADALYKLINKYHAFDWIYLQTMDRNMISKLLQKDSRLKIFLDYTRSQEDIEYALSSGCYGIAGLNAEVTSDMVKSAHQKGLLVQLFGATSTNDLVNTLNKSPDFYLADDILLAQNVLR